MLRPIPAQIPKAAQAPECYVLSYKALLFWPANSKSLSLSLAKKLHRRVDMLASQASIFFAKLQRIFVVNTKYYYGKNVLFHGDLWLANQLEASGGGIKNKPKS